MRSIRSGHFPEMGRDKQHCDVRVLVVLCPLPHRTRECKQSRSVVKNLLMLAKI